MADSEESHADDEHITLRSRLRGKLPEILIEAGSVFLAVLLAFGVNAWHEHSQHIELAAQARAAILSELASNQEALNGSLSTLDTAIRQLRERLNSDAGDKTKEKPVGFPLNTFLASSAAWHSAQVSGAARDFDYAWMLEVARVYELQNLFLHEQQQLMGPVPLVSIPGMEEPDSAAHKLFVDLQIREVIVRMQILGATGANLKRVYAEVLDRKDSVARAATAAGDD